MEYNDYEIECQTEKFQQDISDLEEKVADLEFLFELRRKADHNAIKLWREAKPGRSLRLPDHKDLCVFLMDKLSQYEDDGK